MHNRVFITAVIDGTKEQLVSLMTKYDGPRRTCNRWRGPAASFCGDEDVYFKNGVLVVDVAGGWYCEVDWAAELAGEARRRGLTVTEQSCDLDADDCQEEGDWRNDKEGKYFVYEGYGYSLREEFSCPFKERIATWPQELIDCRNKHKRKMKAYITSLYTYDGISEEDTRLRSSLTDVRTWLDSIYREHTDLESMPQDEFDAVLSDLSKPASGCRSEHVIDHGAGTLLQFLVAEVETPCDESPEKPRYLLVEFRENRDMMFRSVGVFDSPETARKEALGCIRDFCADCGVRESEAKVRETSPDATCYSVCEDDYSVDVVVRKV